MMDSALVDGDACQNMSTNLIDNSLVAEANIPEAQAHLPVESKVHSPSHPADVSTLLIDTEAQPSKRYSTWSWKVIQVELQVWMRPRASPP